MTRLRPARPAPSVDGHALDAVELTAPPVQVGARAMRVGDGWAATVIITGYPATVGLAWLEPVLTSAIRPARVTAALHIDPLPAPAAAAGLRRARARLEASKRLDADRGRLDDPATHVTAADADELARRLAAGQTRLFRVGVYLTVHAVTHHELRQAVAQVRAAAAAGMLDTQPATWRQLQGWTSTLPVGHDALRQRRVMDSQALALAFPLAGTGLPTPPPGRSDPPGGTLLGVTPGTSGVVWWDRWAQHNHNSLVLARSGAGKSYLVKLDVLRSLYDGVKVAVIDPEDEYPPLAAAVGGNTVALGTPGVRINPLDLPAGDPRPDALTRRALFLHTLVAVLLAQPLAPAERAALDAAITVTYQRAGITPDPASWRRPAPLLTDLTQSLATGPQPAGRELAMRLQPWTSGSFSTLFDGPTTTRPVGSLVVWSVRHLPDELRAAGMLLALDAIWRDVDAPHPTPARAGVSGSGSSESEEAARRLVVVDEAWTLLREPEGARFLYRLAKAARKRSAGLVVVTQDAADLLGSDLGQAVAANAATQILMRQAPQAIPAITDAFGLSPDEARALTSLPRGHGLLLGGAHRVGFHAVSSPTEHVLCRGPGSHPGPPSPTTAGGDR